MVVGQLQEGDLQELVVYNHHHHPQVVSLFLDKD